jgi:hypothetical protein
MKGIFFKYLKLQAGIGKGGKMKRTRIMGKNNRRGRMK